MSLISEINYFYYKMALFELLLMRKEDNSYNRLSYNSTLYLNLIYANNNCTVSMISEMLGVSKSAVTIKVNKLVDKGFVKKRQSDKDKRVFYLTISESLFEDYQFYDTALNKIVKEVEKQYSQEEIKLFCNILHNISDFDRSVFINE